MTRLPSCVAARLTIDLQALTANWRYLRQQSPGAACGAVVKADAYGLGLAPVAQALYTAGCRAFFVALVEEGLTLRAQLPQDAQIYVLHGALPGADAACAQAGLIPVLNSLDQVQRWQQQARLVDHRLPAALRADTGMARLGLTEAEWQALAADPACLEGVDIVLVMSHLACAEEQHNPLNALQLQAFRRMKAAWPGIPGSLANSSGIFLGAPYHFDLLRPGAALYGVAPTSNTPNPMRPVVRLQGRMIQCREISEGIGVGYNHTWHAQRPTRVATVSVGYADGYLRSLSNRAQLRFRGHNTPLIGRVSMDTVTVDVSEVPQSLLVPGVWFDLLDDTQDINALAQQAGTNAYEILTSTGSRYQRVYLDER
jgi:alanine racemase